MRPLWFGFGLALATGLTASAASPKAAYENDHSARDDRPSTQEERNKAVVADLYETIFVQGNTNQVPQFFARDFIEHDAALAGGQDGVVTWIKSLQALSPKPTFVIKHIMADGAFVLVHSHLTAYPGNEFSGIARLDLFKLQKENVVEHWAIAQDVPSSSVNGHSMFSDLYGYEDMPPVLTEQNEDANKQVVQKAFAALITGRNYDVLDKYWAGANYIQHNPRIPNGTAPVRAFFSSRPPMVQQFRFVLADGDLVFVFSQSVAASADLNTDYTGSAVGDIARVVDGKIVEHWDVIATVPATTSNGNSVFSELYPVER
jgi:predicted SnoaL-like aldol condensation-catalyzing enzyme